MTWGIESNVVDRFGQAGVPAQQITCEVDTYTFDFPGKPAGFVDLFRTYYGPTMNAVDAAGRNGREDALRGELEELFARQNTSQDPSRTVIPANFLRVTVNVT